MNFEEILPLLKKGERAYRKKDFHYSVPSYIYFEDGEIMRQYMNGVNPCKSYVSYGDIVANDWEIYVEKKDEAEQ